eukprot:4857498-Amphidinium_carterae.1
MKELPIKTVFGTLDQSFDPFLFVVLLMLNHGYASCKGPVKRLTSAMAGHSKASFKAACASELRPYRNT